MQMSCYSCQWRAFFREKGTNRLFCGKQCQLIAHSSEDNEYDDVRKWVNLAQDALPDVIAAANALGGPQIQFVSDEMGYGLFADKEYRKGSIVTTYDGARSRNRVDGSYVLAFPRQKVYIDAEKRFPLEAKGRWINDTDTETENVYMQLDTTKSPIVANMRALTKIAKGEQILWNYGPDYERPWLNH
jgi:endogenous inhibitor of DNA gyrase (YacG/DUF329 family)